MAIVCQFAPKYTRYINRDSLHPSPVWRPPPPPFSSRSMHHSVVSCKFCIFFPCLYTNPVHRQIVLFQSRTSTRVFNPILFIIPCIHSDLVHHPVFRPTPVHRPVFSAQSPSSTRVFIPILCIVPCFYSDLIHRSVVVASTSSRVFIPVLFITLVFILI